MATIRAVATAALLATVSGMSMRRSAMSQSSCSQLVQDGYRFSWNDDQSDVCAAVKVPDASGETQCRVSATG